MNPTLLYGFLTLFAGTLLGYFGVQPIAFAVMGIAALHAAPFLAKERRSKDLAIVGVVGVAHALVFASLAYAVGRGIALSLSA